MDDMVELRCKYCGAPLDRKDIESDSPYITCPSCGTTQQRLDARKYMEQMMGQIQSWIAKTIPGGFAMGSVDNVDPVARHSIYVNSVKPRVDVEINEYRFALNSVIASPLIVLPFSKGEPVRSDHTSTQAFEFQARLKSVEPMAVDDESRKSIVTGEGIANAYAMILNNSKLLTETGSPGRFAIMSKNFLESADAMARCEGYEPLASRLRALSDVCAASDMVLNGDALGCSAKAEEGLAELEAAKRELLSSPRLAVTLRAVDMEISQTRTLKNVADMVLADDNFATIVVAVEEGRKIYDNIRKAIQFLLSSNLAEVIAVFVASMMGVTLLQPTHLLWINLITDAFPAIGLGMEQGEADIMQRPPRSSKDGLFAGGMGVNCAIQGTALAIITLVSYIIGEIFENGAFHFGVGSEDGMTMAFLTLSMAELFHSFNMRSLDKSLFRTKGHNRILYGTLAGALVLTLAVLYIPFLSNAFGFAHISFTEFAIALIIAIMIVPIVEIQKAVQKAIAKKN